jgi:hypothetical protein
MTTDTLYTESQQILVVEDVAPIVALELKDQMPLERTLISLGMDAREHTLKDFLTTFIRLDDIHVPAGGTAAQLITTKTFPQDLLARTEINTKTKGFYLLRTDVEIMMVFTVAPTTSGSFRTITAPDIPSAVFDTRTDNLLRLSQWNNIVINVADAAPVKMIVPYVSPITHINLINDDGAVGGRWGLYINTPLSAPVDITVYARFIDNENFSLSTRTGAVTRFGTTTFSQDMLLHMREKYPNFEAQVSETTTFQKGLSAATTLSSIATKTGVPVLSSIGALATPILSVMKSVGAAFGFSKPQNDAPANPIKIAPLNNTVNADGLDNAQSFGLMAMNEVKTHNGTYGSDTDDMTFKKILLHPNYIGSFQISTATAVNTLIFSRAIWPFNGVSLVDEVTGYSYSLTHQAWVSMFFEKMLANIGFKFRVFATQFHSVKLRFSFVLGANSTDFTGIQPSSNPSVVVHFGKNGEYTCVSPKILNTLMLNSFNSEMNFNDTLSLVPSPNTSIGMLLVTLESPLLVTGAIAASTIDCQVEGFMTDAIFMRPAPVVLRPYMNPPAPDSNPIAQVDDSYPIYYFDDNDPDLSLPMERFVAQMDADYGTNGSTATSSDIPLIPKQDGIMDENQVMAACAGENIKSFKQFLTTYSAPVGITVDEGESNMVIRYSPMASHVTVSPLSSISDSFDIHDTILAGFAFTKGSVRTRVFSTDPSRRLFAASMLNFHGDTYVRLDKVSAPKTPLTGFGTRIIVSSSVLEACSSTQMPYYMRYNCIRNTGIISGTTNDSTINNTKLCLRAKVGESLWFSRAMGDDFTAGYLTALPNFFSFKGSSSHYPMDLDDHP